MDLIILPLFDNRSHLQVRLKLKGLYFAFFRWIGNSLVQLLINAQYFLILMFFFIKKRSMVDWLPYINDWHFLSHGFWPHWTLAFNRHFTFMFTSQNIILTDQFSLNHYIYFMSHYWLEFLFFPWNLINLSLNLTLNLKFQTLFEC